MRNNETVLTIYACKTVAGRVRLCTATDAHHETKKDGEKSDCVKPTHSQNNSKHTDFQLKRT
ncbi:MAG TPA: hypothetical protein PLT59_12535 [Bacteroidales bacterium]|nr:hypothetical protein [Bacteroidales bacterium]